MNQEIYEKFLEQDVMPALKVALDNLETDFQTQKEALKQEYINSFQDALRTINKIRNETKSKTGFLTSHLLRTRILNHHYSYPIISYDREWYGSKGISAGEMDVSFLYKHYEALWQELLRESRKYIQQFSEPDIESIMLRILNPFHKYVVELMRFSLLDSLETEEYLSLSKEGRFEIQSGEYFEPCDLIHMELKEKNRPQIINMIQQSNNQACCFQDFKDLDLSGIVSNGKDLRYSDFRSSHLNEINFNFCLLIGTKFKNSFMKQANLMGTMIHGACFDYADLTDANLQYSVAFTGKNKANAWKDTGFTGVSFRNSILHQADFTGATIMGGDFSGADLTGAIFDEAALYRTRFEKYQLNQCNFSSQQLEQMELIP